MRISDWSSDVCSSDLQPCLVQCPGHAFPPVHGPDSSRRALRSATLQPSATSSSAIWTAFSAAPLRMLSETTHRLSPRSCDRSSRMRPTKRSEEHTSELQSLMRISYAVLCLNKK